MSLRGKLLAFTVGVVVLLTALSLVILHLLARDHARRGVEESLLQSHKVLHEYMRERVELLKVRTRLVAEDPSFVAFVDIEGAEFQAHVDTVLRELPVLEDSLRGTDRIRITNADRRTLYHRELGFESSRDLSSMPGVEAALRGHSGDYEWTLDGVELRVFVSPVREGTKVYGALVLGTARKFYLEQRLPFAEREGRDQNRLRGVQNLAASTNVRGFFGVEDPQMSTEEEAPVIPLPASSSAPFLFAEAVRAASAVDLVALVSTDGIAAVRLPTVADYGDDEGRLPGVAAALEGEEFIGLESTDGRLFQAAVAPVWTRDSGFVGTLGLGFAIDDRFTELLAQLTQAEVSLINQGQVFASTASTVAVATVGSPDWRPELTGEVFKVMVEGEEYLSILGHLEGGSEYLIQYSLDGALTLWKTMERTLIIMGIVILGIAALSSFFGAARISRPLRALVNGTQQLAAGDLSYRIGVESRDEMGQLARSFNDMSKALASSLEALRESERQYRGLFDNARDMVYTTDLRMNLTSVNKSGVDLTGFRQAELLTRSFYDLLAPESAQRLRDSEGRLELGQHRPSFEVDVVRKDASRVTVEVVSRWMLQDGQVVGIHGIARDISRRREREREAQLIRERLHQTDKLQALGEMAAGVAHNFNNLLTGIMGYAELIIAHQDTPAAAREDARKIVEWTHRCAAVVRRIKTFGRPVDIRNREAVKLHQLVRDTLEVTRPKWETEPQRQGRTVRISLDLREVPILYNSKGAWEEILSNLVFNAVDAMPDGGEIRISTWVEGDRTVLSVTDSGVGMDATTRQRVFEPFYTTKGPELGTGLGLSTVWGLVQAFGGEIDVASTPGQGTTFLVRVPVDRGDKTVSRRREVVDPDELPSLKILVVDDEAATRETLTRLLSSHRVTAVSRGEEGLEALDGEDYDLVISDWSMAGLSGLEVAAEVRRRSPATVICLASGWEVHGAPDGHSSAIDLRLQKPIDRPTLEGALRQAQRIRRQRRGLLNVGEVSDALSPSATGGVFT